MSRENDTNEVFTQEAADEYSNDEAVEVEPINSDEESLSQSEEELPSVVEDENPGEENAPVEPVDNEAEAAEQGENSPESDEQNPDEDVPPQEAPVQQNGFAPRKYAENYYLLFGKDQVLESLDLEGTKGFLNELGFEGGELLQARREKETAHEFESQEENDSELFCSYCDQKISGVDYYRLRDGRYRCTQCSRSLVKNIEQVEEIFKKVLRDMEVLFDAVITPDIQIELTDERTIKKRCKLSIGDVDNSNILIFGVAIKDKEGYSICIENSLPRIRVISTLVHELTHIWQYENWDKEHSQKQRKCIFKRRPKGGILRSSRPLEDYEGMAKWAQIQYLYLIGETKMATREEYITRRRKDEYGRGFLKYEELYPLQKKAMTKGKSPFNSTEE